MTRPHREIPSQRLAVSVSRLPPTGPATKPHRSVWWLVAITLVGWALLAYPALILALLSYVITTGTTDSPATAASVAIGLLGFVATLCMVAFPLLLGLAVKARRRTLWLAAILTGVLAVAACIYIVGAWIIPLS